MTKLHLHGPRTAGLLLLLPFLAAPHQGSPTSAPIPRNFNAMKDLASAWCVTGRVSDAQGRPLPGVLVSAMCGDGTLRCTGIVPTNDQGEYTLRFGPGRHWLVGDRELHIQAATIVPRKPGYFERNLHRRDDYLLADRMPTPEEWLRHVGRNHQHRPLEPERLVLPQQPRRVDFVMVPAARVAGRLVDPAGRAIAGIWVSLAGKELPPSSSVLATCKTDDTGAFTLSDLATKDLWFCIHAYPRPEARTDSRSFATPGEYAVELVFDVDAQPSPTLAIRKLERPQ